jgi:hypothetical protein
MANSTIEELQLENQELRELVASLSVTLLRNLALDPPKYRGQASSADVHRLLEEAEQCFRCAKIPGLKTEVTEGLEVGANELMARAVEIETKLQREKWDKQRNDPRK